MAASPPKPSETLKHTTATPTMTARLIMQGKEVGTIIGKNGEIIKNLRNESGAKIYISSGACTDRVVTVSGTKHCVQRALSSICEKFEDDSTGGLKPCPGPKPPITFHVIVPSVLCGTLIGKGGSTIKHLREVTGASILIASDMLPNSTERAVTISGSSKAVSQCIYNICNIMAESPQKGVTLSYKPSQAGIQADPASSCPGSDLSSISSSDSSYINFTPMQQSTPPYPVPLDTFHILPPMLNGSHIGFIQQTPQLAGNSPLMYYPNSPIAPQHMFSPPIHLNLGTNTPPHREDQMKKPSVAAPVQSVPNMAPTIHSLPKIPQSLGFHSVNGLVGIGSPIMGPPGVQNGGRGSSNHQVHEMTVPNEIIGCVIGKGGSKISEIRQISGAMIRISNCEDRDAPANLDRTITISGNSESVALALYLINMRISMETASLGGVTGFQYISPNHIIKSEIQ